MLSWLTHQRFLLNPLAFQYPPAATMPNAKGKIPLHYAAREGRVEMVRFFLQTVPRTAAIASDKKKLALHFAAGDGHTTVVRDLLTVYPQGASLQSAKGKIPLHFASRWGHLQIAYDLLSVYPEGVRALDWEGSLPIHDAAREGQYRMCRYLLERFPAALCAANMRGEIPLFPAVRSGNLDLVVLMIQTWPAGGRHILKNLCADDNVDDWEIVELLLRGAVHNFHGCTLLEDRDPPSVCLSNAMDVISHSDENYKKNKKAKHGPLTSPTLADSRALLMLQPIFPHNVSLQAEENSDVAPASLPTAVDLPIRSKSPILDAGEGNRKKRSDQSSGERKRHRMNSIDASEHESRKIKANPRVFLPLHAAFEAGSSYHVLNAVLEKYPDFRSKQDENCRLPIHWAMTNCRNDDDYVTFVTEKLINQGQANVRDGQNRLPLHIAIAARADARIIKSLLDEYPTAGVNHCRSRDEWYDKYPIEMGVHFDCDLSTVYQLLRVDPSVVKRI